MSDKVTNVVFAGIGGQGVLKAADILSETVFNGGCDLKQSEIHGMSQRGGSVTSEVRYGENVLSPMIPTGKADALVVFTEDQVEVNRHLLREGGVLITPDIVPDDALENRKSLNVALLGVLNHYLKLDEKLLLDAIKANLPEKLHAMNVKAFAVGKALAT